MKKLFNRIISNRIYKRFIAGCTHLTTNEEVFLDYSGTWENHYSADNAFETWKSPIFLDYSGKF